MGKFVAILLVFFCGVALGYRSAQYHNPPLSPDCERPKSTLEVAYQWKQLGFYDFPVESSDFTFGVRRNDSLIPYNNVPIGIAPSKNRLFITVPRRAPGIPSTLNYIDLNAKAFTQSPLLMSFPDVETNRFDPNSPQSSDRIISVYRPRVDYACNRLWFVDTGLLEYGERIQVQPASIWVLDLTTGQRIRRFEIPTSAVDRGNGLVSITVDSQPDACDQAFAYIPDMSGYRLHVFSLAENRLWSFAHNFFYLDPLYGDLFIAGQRFQWRDGIFSVTLGPYLQENGNREAYFHSMASLNEFVVSTAVLKNSTNSARSFHGEDFKLLGQRRQMGQTNMHAFDETTGVVFSSEIARNSVGCWNSGEQFVAENHDTVLRDDENLVYPSDLAVDDEGNVWVLSNRIPQFVYSRLNEEEYSFKVWKGKGSEIIKGTKCE